MTCDTWRRDDLDNALVPFFDQVLCEIVLGLLLIAGHTTKLNTRLHIA
jgi:hypothetical protein